MIIKSKFIILLVFLIHFSLFSQTNISSLLLEKFPVGGSLKISLLNKNRQKFLLGVSKFKNLKRGKVIDIYKDKTKGSECSLIPFYNANDVDIYILLLNRHITEIINPAKISKNKGKKVIISLSNAFGFFLIYDNKNDRLLYINSSESAGSISSSSVNNEIEIDYGTVNLVPHIIKLNDNLMPVSSLQSINNENDNSNFAVVSNYYLDHNIYKAKGKKINMEKYSSVFKLSFQDLYSYLDTKFDDYDFNTVACNEFECDADISWMLKPYK
jgi:hypothetical protein